MSIALPKQQAVKSKTLSVSAFYGFDRRPTPREGGLALMTNLSVGEYPYLTTRSPRGILRRVSKPHGLVALNGLLLFDGTTLYHDGVAVAGLTLTDTDKRTAAMGAKLVILPDKIVYDTVAHTYEAMEQTNTSSGTVSVRVSTRDGGAYDDVSVGTEPPTSPKNGDIWLDTSGETHVLKLFSSLYGTWQSMAATYIRLSFAGIGEGLKAGDGVTLSGFTDSKLNGTFVIASRDTDWLVIPGLVDAAFDETATVTVKRSLPALDCITECGNRLWGTCNAEHALYASAPGDPCNFYRYRGISDDAYAVTVGSPGDFTGITGYGGAVVAFKGDRLIRVTGSVPSRFRLTELICPGMAGDGDCAVLGNILYYTALDGLYAYSGSNPVHCSAALGDWRFSRARLGKQNNGLYLSVTAEGVDHLLLYSTETGLFSRQDNTRVTAFATLAEELYFLAGNTLFSAGGTLLAGTADSDATQEGICDFLGQTGDLRPADTERASATRITLRAEAGEGALLRVELLCDGEPPREVMRLTAGKSQCQTAYVLPRAACAVRLRFSGYGPVRIAAFTVTTVST